MVTFQILVPTMPGREDRLGCLLKVLEGQCRFWPGVSVHVVGDREGMPKESIGAKRQRAVEEATAAYVAFVDDDDSVRGDYLDRIMPLLEEGPDCVGLTVAYYENGVFQCNYYHKLENRENTAWHGRDRTPHHLCAVRREIARQVRFRDVSWGEDYAWAMGILPLLRTGAFAGPEAIYEYRFVFGKPGSVL